MIKLTFYGVRGSIPSPGGDSLKYGGNTPCIYIEADHNFHLVLDSGTGIITLGDLLIKDHKPIYLLLSHNHWDHIQGFPFFRPAYQKDREINIITGLTEPNEPLAILNQLQSTYFPVNSDELSANISIASTTPMLVPIILGNVTILRQQLNHPNAGSAYLFTQNGNSFAYITDNELQPPNHQFTTIEQWIDFIQDVDLLIHDSQYFPEDFPEKSGWGHSPWDQVVDLAITANVDTLCLFSHDYRRSDKEIEQMLAIAQAKVKHQKAFLKVYVARESCGFTIGEE